MNLSSEAHRQHIQGSEVPPLIFSRQGGISTRSFLAFFFGAACLSVACLCASLTTLPGRPTPVPAQEISLSPGSTEVVGAACLRSLSDTLERSENTYLFGEELETDFTLVTYTVSGDSISHPVKLDPIPPKLKKFQDDTEAQQKLWDFFIDIIPAARRAEVTQFAVFTDGPNATLGSVEQLDDPRYWQLDMDIQDGQSFADLSTTLIHEFAHLLTLNESQVVPDMDVFENPNDPQVFDHAAAGCPTYFMLEGCSRPVSYINNFYNRFWAGLYTEWKMIDAESDDATRNRKLDDFYYRYSNQFSSSYAVTSPEEDIAESFMYFIFNPRPVGNNIAAQKQLFFYEAPELVALREHILSHLCTYVTK